MGAKDCPYARLASGAAGTTEGISVHRSLSQNRGHSSRHRRVYCYRHRPAILKYLGVTLWGASARKLAESTMMKLASARTDPADLINAAVDILVQSRFELSALVALRRIAGTAHRQVNAGQWREVCDHLDEQASARLEALLIVDPKTQQSPFAELCRPAGSATRKNLNAFIARYEWLLRYPIRRRRCAPSRIRKSSSGLTRRCGLMRWSCANT